MRSVSFICRKKEVKIATEAISVSRHLISSTLQAYKVQLNTVFILFRNPHFWTLGLVYGVTTGKRDKHFMIMGYPWNESHSALHTNLNSK